VGEGQVHVEDGDEVGVRGAQDPAGHVPSREPELAGAAHDAAFIRASPRRVEPALRRHCAAAVLPVVAGEDEVDGREIAGAVQ